MAALLAVALERLGPVEVAMVATDHIWFASVESQSGDTIVHVRQAQLCPQRARACLLGALSHCEQDGRRPVAFLFSQDGEEVGAERAAAHLAVLDAVHGMGLEHVVLAGVDETRETQDAYLDGLRDNGVYVHLALATGRAEVAGPV